MAPLTMAPLTMAPLTMAPLTMAPLTMAPLTMAPAAPQDPPCPQDLARIGSADLTPHHPADPATLGVAPSGSLGGFRSGGVADPMRTWDALTSRTVQSQSRQLRLASARSIVSSSAERGRCRNG